MNKARESDAEEVTCTIFSPYVTHVSTHFLATLSWLFV
jgi:hypothetical protein